MTVMEDRVNVQARQTNQKQVTNRHRTGVLGGAAAGRRRIFLVTARKACPLPLSARLVWSFLLLKARRGRGASRYRIARSIGPGRVAVATAVRLLMAAGLVEQMGPKLRAVPPAGEAAEWFPTRKAVGPWCERFAYLVVPVPGPACPLSTDANAVLWLLHDLARGTDTASRVSARGVGVMLGVHRRTVARAMGKLAGLGVIRVTRRPGRKALSDVTFANPTSGMTDWYEPLASAGPDSVSPPAAREPKTVLNDVTVEDVLKQSKKVLAGVDIPEDAWAGIARAVFDLLAVDETFKLGTLKRKAEWAARKNRETGRADHPGYLLLSMIRKQAKEAKEAAA